MTLQYNQQRTPKAALHRTVRNVAKCREILALPLLAVEYLRHAAETVSPDDVQNARTPWCYERVDDIAHALVCDPRQVQRIEGRLVELGLIEKRTLANGHRHAKRCRKTGALLWVHGISLRPLIQRHDELEALATNRADIDREYRATRQQVNNLRARLKDALAAAAEYPALTDLRDRTWAIYDAVPGRVTYRLYDLTGLVRLRTEMILAVETMIEALDMLAAPSPEAGDNGPSPVHMSDASDTRVRHKYPTTSLILYSCRNAGQTGDDEIRNPDKPASSMTGMERKGAGDRTGYNPQNAPIPENHAPKITARHLLGLAPDRWSENLGDPDRVDWRVIGFVADARRAELGVSERAWRIGVERMGPRSAAICLAILDTNRNHPTSPVRSVGGAFVAMTRRAEAGTLNLEPSINWIAARRRASRGDGAAPHRRGLASATGGQGMP